MKKFIDFIYKAKKFLMAFMAISVILSIYGIVHIKLNTDFSLFSTDNSTYQASLDDVSHDFGALNQITLLIESDTFDQSLTDKLYDLQRTLETKSYIDFVEGAAPEMLVINTVATPYQDIAPEMILSYYSTFQEFSPISTLNNHYYISYTLFINDSFDRTNLHGLEDLASSYDFTHYYLSGDDYSQIKIADYIIQILLILPPLALLVIFTIFRSQMKNLKATIFSVLPAGIGSLWTLGIIGLIGKEVSILTAIVPIFIIVIGSADGLHFVSHYQELKHEGKSTKESLVKTLSIVGVPMIITTLTSVAGFLSLLTMNTSSVFDLAIYSSVGIFLAGVATWFVLPLILSTDIRIEMKHHKVAKHRDVFKKAWGFPSVIIVLLLLIASLLYMPKINNEFDMLMVYKDYTEVKQSADVISEVNGGSIPLYVYIKLDQSPISLETKTYIDQIASTLSNSDDTTKILNPYHMFDIMFEQMTGAEISTDQQLQMVYQSVVSNQDNIITHFINNDQMSVRLLVFPKDLSNETLLNIQSLLSNDPNVEVTGVQYLMMDLNTSINQMQLNSILFALGVVLLLMLISLRSFKLAILSILPIVITIITLYGFLGLTQIPLNITTVMIFSITIGVGIDYAVHYSSTYRHFLKEGMSNLEAIDMSYQYASRPIMTNAFGISLGLSIMMFSPLTIHFNVSVLMWVSMIVSVFVTLTLLPTLYRIKRK